VPGIRTSDTALSLSFDLVLMRVIIAMVPQVEPNLCLLLYIVHPRSLLSHYGGVPGAISAWNAGHFIAIDGYH